MLLHGTRHWTRSSSLEDMLIEEIGFPAVRSAIVAAFSAWPWLSLTFLLTFEVGAVECPFMQIRCWLLRHETATPASSASIAAAGVLR